MKYLIFIAALPLLAACNTMEGMGKDVERGGEKLQDAAYNAHHGEQQNDDGQNSDEHQGDVQNSGQYPNR